MFTSIARVALVAVAMVIASTSFALAETKATPAPKTTKVAQTVAQDSATAPLPTPDPLTLSGFFRSYYFTRQNATGYPGTQLNFTTLKCPSGGTCVNQASWNNAIDLHAEYKFGSTPWSIGGTYFYAQPFNGPCSVARNHAKGDPCVSQLPPNTNPDDTLPGFMMSTFPEAYLAFNGFGANGKAGDFLMQTPWAASYDATRLKPAAYQGADLAYSFDNAWTVEAAQIFQFSNRTSNTFNSNTLLTSYPAGGGGLASNIYVPGCANSDCGGITTHGFVYGRLSYAPKNSNYSVDGYLYGVANIVSTYWGDARYTWSQSSFKPFVALQGGWENNAGNSVIGKINSQDIGVQIGANVAKDVVLTAGFDSIPWKYDQVVLPGAATCSSSTYQISAGDKVFPATNFAYFLPLNAAQCMTNKATGLTTVAYGGWASPYTDNYATDPFFTTQISQGMADRRAPGNSWKLAATYTSPNKKWVFIASDAWYNYGNSIAAQNTTEWNLDGTYKFSAPKPGRYKGLLLRYRYAQRYLSNTFFCGYSAACPAGQTAANQAAFLGGLPLFKYNRAQVEYDF